MKKFQQLFQNQPPNQYGLPYKQIKSTKSQLKNIQNSYTSLQNPQTVQVYLHPNSNNKSMKMKLTKRSKLQKLKQTIEDKLLIPFQDQLIYLNGKQISIFSSITLNDKQIIHITDRKNIVQQNDHLIVHLKISAQEHTNLNNKTLIFQLTGGEKVISLKNLIISHTDFQDCQNGYQFSFLESSRILNKQDSFTQNLIAKTCNIVCLISQNQIQTKFINECQQNAQQRDLNYQRIEPFNNTQQKNNQPTKKPLTVEQLLSFKKTPHNSNKFLIEKGKSDIYTKIANKANHTSQFVRSQVTKRKSQSDMMYSPTGFKKKKHCQSDYDSDDSNLMTKIVVHKSRQEIQKLASQNSLMKQKINQVDEEKKSVVSSSSSDQKDKQYIPIRQQKQYRPCPLIPQQKMAPSQKIKINMQLQKLFSGQIGQQQKLLISQKGVQNKEELAQFGPQIQTTRSRVVVRNQNMRNSISAKQSMMRIIKDRKPNNRYAQQNMYEGD